MGEDKVLITLKDKEHYQVDLSELDKAVFPRVSAILNETVNKAAPLMWWAANTAIDYVRYLVESCNTKEQIFELVQSDGLWTKAQNRHKEMARLEADKGKRVHKIVEEIFRAEMTGGEMTLQITEDIKNPVNAFLEWKDAHDVHPVMLEENVYAILPGYEEVEDESKRIGYAGRFDNAIMCDGLFLVNDIKSGKDIYYEQLLQAAAYEFAFRYTNAEMEWETNGASILRLDKETGEPDFLIIDPETCKALFDDFYARTVAYHNRHVALDMMKAKKKAAKDADKIKAKALLDEPDPY